MGMTTTHIRYLTGVSTEQTRMADRPELGLLVTPDSGVFTQRSYYQGGWAADNALFTAELPGDFPYVPKGEGGHFEHTATSRMVRYGPEPKKVKTWWNWIQGVDPTGCLFATVPDVVGDYAATWERSSHYIARLRSLGFPVAVVLQDGVEHDRFVFGSILNGADAVFIGGSTDWKISPAVTELVRRAKERGLWVHMGRVNSGKRLLHAQRIGCDSADGTFMKFCAKKDQDAQYARMERWFDLVNEEAA